MSLPSLASRSSRAPNRRDVRKFLLDSNCYIDASTNAQALMALQEFVTWAAPGLHVSSVVAAELRAGARSVRDRRIVEDRLLGPFARNDRILTPSAAAWDALGRTLATLRDRDGLALAQVNRSFAFDVLIAFTCREHGALLVTANARDMTRIRRIFAFDFVAPYPAVP